MYVGSRGGAARSGFGGPTRERSSIKHLGHLKKLLPYLKRYKWILIICIFALLIQRWCMAYFPQLMRTAIDSLTYDHIDVNLSGPALGMLVLVAIQAIIYIPARRVLRRMSITITYDLRKRFFHNVQYQGPAFFNLFSTGDLMSRAHNDVNQVRMAASWGWVQLATIVFTLCTGLYYMFDMSVELSIYVLLPTPFVAITGFFMARGMYPYFRERQEAQARVSTLAQENLNGIRTIQAMAQEEHEINRFRQVSTEYIKKYYRAVRYQAFMGFAMSAITTISPLIILGYGGYLVLQGEITIGTFTAFTAYLMMVTQPIASIGWSLSMFTAAAASTERIFEVVDYIPEVKDSSGSSVEIDEVQGRLEFKNLSYTYPGGATKALNNVNIVLDPGETIAILGRVGSGKSTVLRAAVRFVDTPRGMVYLDGHDICDYNIRDLRRHIGLVPQYPFLFSATIKENLTYDDPSRGDEEIWEAAHAAGLDDAIKDLLYGLDTIVGERGITLSGGQKQRATLARGLIRQTEILLLDDCFSSVDTETEERIIEGLHAMRSDLSTILISHRVSTARHADRIYVLDNGKILESGTHEELLSKGGYYADLEAIQSNQDEDRSKRDRLIEKLQDEQVTAV